MLEGSLQVPRGAGGRPGWRSLACILLLLEGGRRDLERAGGLLDLGVGGNHRVPLGDGLLDLLGVGGHQVRVGDLRGHQKRDCSDPLEGEHLEDGFQEGDPQDH